MIALLPLPWLYYIAQYLDDISVCRLSCCCRSLHTALAKVAQLRHHFYIKEEWYDFYSRLQQRCATDEAWLHCKALDLPGLASVWSHVRTDDYYYTVLKVQGCGLVGQQLYANAVMLMHQDKVLQQLKQFAQNYFDQECLTRYYSDEGPYYGSRAWSVSYFLRKATPLALLLRALDDAFDCIDIKATPIPATLCYYGPTAIAEFCNDSVEGGLLISFMRWQRFCNAHPELSTRQKLRTSVAAELE